MRIFLLYIAFVLSSYSYGQTSIRDTIRINEVIIDGSQSFSGADCYKITVIDSAVMRDNYHESLSEIISGNTPIFIKSYGAGGIATVSFRGTGASHTQLAWNEININSPMLGQADLALLPAGFIDDVRIFHGGASLSVNNGGFGGIINIETKPDWNNETNILFNLGAGSFGKYSGLIKARAGNNEFQSVTKAFFKTAEYDFKFINSVISPVPVTEKRKNAQVSQYAFMQELYCRKGKNIASARLWYQKSDRNLPVPMIVQLLGPGETQKDEFFRSMINFNRYMGNIDYDLSVSWFSEKLNYMYPAASVDSRNYSNSVLIKAGFRTFIRGKIRFQVVLNDEWSRVNSNNYVETEKRNQATIAATVKKIFGEKLNSVLLVRQILNDHKLLVPDYSAALDFRMFKNKEHFLKLNFSRNSKVPTLNDMFWNPGGNADLKNEFSYSGELTYEMSRRLFNTLDCKTEITAFAGTIHDMISWRPGNNSFWSPSNVSNVRTKGIETGISLAYANNDLSVKFSGQYAFNKAYMVAYDKVDVLSKNQLIYIPEHQVNAATCIYFRNLFASWIASYTGKRYTSADNSQSLQGYVLNNINTGIKLKPGKNTFDLNFRIENLLNIDYQVIAYHPMPGRSFHLTVVYQIAK